MYPLMIPTPLSPGYQKEVIEDLKARPPEVIVLAMTNYSWLFQKDSPEILSSFLAEILNKNYNLTGGFIWVGNQGKWQEPLNNEQLLSSSLIVFKARNTH